MASHDACVHVSRAAGAVASSSPSAHCVAPCLLARSKLLEISSQNTRRSVAFSSRDPFVMQKRPSLFNATAAAANLKETKTHAMAVSHEHVRG